MGSWYVRCGVLFVVTHFVMMEIKVRPVLAGLVLQP